MKPILILQHLDTDGPAYLGTWLRSRGLEYEVRNTEAGEAFPATIDGHSALAVLGGAMSANDPLPSLRRAERLILQAMERDVPVIGLCLGGQLMARALGAAIKASPAPEIGWQPLRVAIGSPAAQAWFGERTSAEVMQWHYEMFDLPSGADLLATSDACAHQAFSIGPHLGLQFHLEIDEAKLRVWAAEESQAWREAHVAHPASVQDGPGMLSRLPERMTPHQTLADRIFGRWISFAS